MDSENLTIGQLYRELLRFYRCFAELLRSHGYAKVWIICDEIAPSL